MKLERLARWTTRTRAHGLALFDRFTQMRRPDVYVARKIGRVLSDRAYLAIGHWLYFGNWPNYEKPRTLNEHIHAYMLRCRAPILKIAADKVAARKYIEEHAGAHYLVPCYGVWQSAEDVPVEALPRPCVLKPTAASGVVQFLRDDEQVDPDRVRARMRFWLGRDYSQMHREWSYSGLRCGIMAEQMLLEADGSVPPDYKAYVIGGKVRFVQVDRGRFAHHTRNLYSTDWELLPVRLTIGNHAPDPRPSRLEEMIEVSERLAVPFEFLRIDCYVVNDKLYIGELTNTPGAGFEKFIPESFAEEFGSYWVIRGRERSD